MLPRTDRAMSADRMVFMVNLLLILLVGLEVVAVDLLVEGLGVERAGRRNGAGDDRQGDEG